MKTRLLAMWSGPRNISTAMMRSWGSRTDSVVIDEPFYAHYLDFTGVSHPGAQEIIASQSTHWPTVVRQITEEVPQDRALYYQKHITTHMLPPIELAWLDRLSHCFLIRDPDYVVASYTRKRPDAAADDLGYAQQCRIFEHVCAHVDSRPPVIDTEQFLRDPAAQLAAVCSLLGIDFQHEMLSWEPGIHDTDGIWHRYWYDAVAQSTGFKPYKPVEVVLDDQQQTVADQCRPHYEKMKDRVLNI